MLRRRRLVSFGAATATIAAMTIVGMTGSAGAETPPSHVPLAGSVTPFASHVRASGAVTGSAKLTIQVWLQTGDLAAAQQYAAAVRSPGSKLFRHYLGR